LLAFCLKNGRFLQILQNVLRREGGRKRKKRALISKRPFLLNYGFFRQPFLKTSGTTGHLPSPIDSKRELFL
jgi:hypothetical protein